MAKNKMTFVHVNILELNNCEKHLIYQVIAKLFISLLGSQLSVGKNEFMYIRT